MNGHDFPTLFDPETEEEFQARMQESADEDRAYEEMLEAQAQLERQRAEEYDELIEAQAKDSRESAKAMLTATKTCDTLLPYYEAIHPFQVVEPSVPDEEEDDGQFWNSGEIYAMGAE